ncbi:MAG: right-handed parallel beta-helix repeat-containing protein [Candidatus Bathyarchaeia archaeon]
MENFKKIVIAELVIIGLLLALLVYALSKPAVCPVAASYTVWREGDEYYAADTSGIRFSGKNASQVIQSAIDALTPGRTWKEKILLKGDFTISTPIIVRSYTALEFQGKITVADNANIDAAIKSEGFDDLAGTDSTGGVVEVEIVGLKLDGNKAKQTKGFGLKLYGRKLTMKDVNIYYCKEDGIWTEWSTNPNVTSPEDAMEGIFSNIRSSFNDGRGWRMLGPHDSYLTDILLYCNRLVGFACWGEGGCQGINLHAYGNGEVGFYIDAPVIFTNIVSESNNQSGVIVLHNDVYLDGNFYNNHEYGIVMGDESHAPAGCYIRGKTLGHPIDKAGLLLVNGSTNRYELHMWENNTSIKGTPSVNDKYIIVNTNNSKRSQNSGTATIPSRNTSVTIPHSLIWVPKIVVVTGRDNETACAYVSYRNETHITITVPNPVTADREVDWYAEI